MQPDFPPGTPIGTLENATITLTNIPRLRSEKHLTNRLMN
jgi:hypothetical protein